MNRQIPVGALVLAFDVALIVVLVLVWGGSLAGCGPEIAARDIPSDTLECIHADAS